MPQEEPNKGPTGGSYANENNYLEIGGETHPTEPKAMNAEAIAYAGSQDAPELGSQVQAGEDLAGGNKGSSQMSAPGSTPESLRGGNYKQDNPSNK